MVEMIDLGSNNSHRLIIAPDGQRLYTENEEDATISVIDLPRRKLLGKIRHLARLPGLQSRGTAAQSLPSTTGAGAVPGRQAKRAHSDESGSRTFPSRRRSPDTRRVGACSALPA